MTPNIGNVWDELTSALNGGEITSVQYISTPPRTWRCFYCGC